jgi:hypothetical protein
MVPMVSQRHSGEVLRTPEEFRFSGDTLVLPKRATFCVSSFPHLTITDEGSGRLTVVMAQKLI